MNKLGGSMAHEVPPVGERSNDDLFSMIENPQDWQPDVLERGRKELEKRGFDMAYQQRRFERYVNHQSRVAKTKAMAQYSSTEKLLIVLLYPVTARFNGFFSQKGPGYDTMNRQGFFYSILGIGFWIVLIAVWIRFFGD
jgi:hypothetical protein